MYKILIADDENFIRRGLAGCLDWESLGCKLIGTASNGLEALELIAQEQPDIIISDINMDSMSGLELVEHLNYQYPEIKCILFTGIYEFNNVYNAIKFDVVDLILKPTSPARIEQALSKAIYQIETQKSQQGLIQQIKTQTRQNLKLKQAMLLSNILEDSSSYKDCIEDVLNNIQLELKNYAFITILLSQPETHEDEASSFFNAEKTVQNYIEPLFEDMEYYCTFSVGKSIYILVNYSELSSNTLTDIYNICTDLNKTIDNLTNFYCSIGISAFHSNVNELTQTASESLNAANFATYDNVCSIAKFADMPPISTETINYIRSYITRLLQAINSEIPNPPQEILCELFEYCEEHKISLDEIRSICILISNLCIYNLWQCNDTDSQYINPKDSERRLHDNLRLEDLKSTVKRIVADTIANLSSNEESSFSLIDKIEKYIKNNYKDELSLEKISQEFHISQSYLSRLFKSKKEISITNYIQKVRIDNAKDLILKTDMRTYEIASAVGIPDPVYFSKIFKKTTGMRVRDYRDTNI